MVQITKASNARTIVITVLLTIIGCTLLLLSGCGNEETQSDASNDDAKATDVTETTAPKQDLSDVYAQYEKYLTENASAIEEYETCTAAEYASGKDRAVSFCDITGDDVPEMFVMKYVHGGDEGPAEYGQLFIYTCAEGKIEEMPYAFHRTDQATEGVVDFNVIAGGFCEYAAYLGKDGHLYLFSGSNNESSYAYLDRYGLTDDGILLMDYQLTWSDIVDMSEVKHEYTEDGKRISEADFKDKVDVAFADMDKMIIYGAGTFDGEFSTDLLLWKNLDESKALNMSCQDAIAFAKEQQ